MQVIVSEYLYVREEIIIQRDNNIYYVLTVLLGILNICVCVHKFCRYPDPEVEWYRNNEKLYPSERIKIEKEITGLLRLSIANVDPLVDAAKYKIRIYNDYGEDECEASFIFDCEYKKIMIVPNLTQY